jgi:hypothetical protein
MIRKIYAELVPHVPPALSPMVAAGRAVKHLHPDAVTVFIGPCLAKKAEAREKDIAGAVDYVLTFQEVQDIFKIMAIDPAEMEDSEKDHSSRAGRIYAYGGVSEAVAAPLKKLNPERNISIKTRTASGVADCEAMMKALREGETDANFFEWMGCVGGPRAILERELGKEHVEEYGAAALTSPVWPKPSSRPPLTRNRPPPTRAPASPSCATILPWKTPPSSHPENAIPSDVHAELLGAFENHEESVLGEGTHEKRHEMLHAFTKKHLA